MFYLKLGLFGWQKNRKRGMCDGFTPSRPFLSLCHTHTNTHTYTNTHTHTDTHWYTHTHTHTGAHTHTQFTSLPICMSRLYPSRDGLYPSRDGLYPSRVGLGLESGYYVWKYSLII